MSSRRLARAGKAVTVAGGVPDALSLRRDPLWEDPEAVARLASRYGVALEMGQVRLAGPVTLASAHPWTRFSAFRHAWCLANGFEHREEAGYVARERARDAGVDVSSSAVDCVRWGTLSERS